MKIDHFPMDNFAASAEGSAILRTAHENNAWHIIQRLAPSNSAENPDGAYLVMLLDWPAGMIVRMVFDHEEVSNLSTALNSLKGMDVFDAFDVEGATKQ